MIRCCYGCVAPKRHPGCHATCPDYIKEKKQHEEELEARRKVAKDNERVADVHFAAASKRLRKKKRR